MDVITKYLSSKIIFIYLQNSLQELDIFSNLIDKEGSFEGSYQSIMDIMQTRFFMNEAM